MKIVIDIPEEIYKHYKKIWQKRRGSIPESCIAFGTPIPKGHGRIVDIDKVLEEMMTTRTYDIPFALERVKPIIEADTESEE